MKGSFGEPEECLRAHIGQLRLKRESDHRSSSAFVSDWPISAKMTKGMSSQSPLKAKPLRNAGDSVDEELRGWTEDRLLEVSGGTSIQTQGEYP
jgi:hypothetical protein